MATTVCKRVIYRGRVQGVGFRYTVNGLARGYAAAGFVRNLPTGEVELAAEARARSGGRLPGRGGRTNGRLHRIGHGARRAADRGRRLPHPRVICEVL